MSKIRGLNVYYIRKAFRDATEPYTGPICDEAGVEPGQWYNTRSDADADAAKLSEHNSVGFKVEFLFNGGLPNLFHGFTIEQWFSHHPPRTEARKAEHGRVDKAIKGLAEKLFGLNLDTVKESAAEECTAEIRTIRALSITIEWAATYIDEAREAIYLESDRDRVRETCRLLSQARQSLHQGIALHELRQMAEANPEEVQLREEISGRGRETEEECVEKLKGRLEASQECLQGITEAAADCARQRDAALARVAELEERLQLDEDEDAEAYIDELEGEVASLGELRYQVNFLSSVLADVNPGPEIWGRIAATIGAMKKEIEQDITT